jgi:hypothetical protein
MNDYIKQLEAQNDELKQMLALSQRFNEYYYNNRILMFRCGVTFVHNKNTTDAEYYTSNEYTHRVDRIAEHGGLGMWVSMCCSVDDEIGLTKMGMHVGLYRNDMCVWDVFFRVMPSGNWVIDAIQFSFKDLLVSGVDIKNSKEYDWNDIIIALSKRGERYKQFISF